MIGFEMPVSQWPQRWLAPYTNCYTTAQHYNKKSGNIK
jgi:hypothetical protein